MRVITNLTILAILLALTTSLALVERNRHYAVSDELRKLDERTDQISVIQDAPHERAQTTPSETFPAINPPSTSTTDLPPTTVTTGDLPLAIDEDTSSTKISTPEPGPVRHEQRSVTPQAPNAPPTITHDYVDALATAIHRITNERRARKNIPALVYDVRLETVATERSLDMASRDYFSHTTPDGCDIECHFDATTLQTIAWGENIGWFEPYQIRTPEALGEYFVDWWIDSRSHRENLLAADFTHEGIGIAVRGDKIIVTVVFGDW